MGDRIVKSFEDRTVGFMHITEDGIEYSRTAQGHHVVVNLKWSVDGQFALLLSQWPVNPMVQLYRMPDAQPASNWESLHKPALLTELWSSKEVGLHVLQQDWDLCAYVLSDNALLLKRTVSVFALPDADVNLSVSPNGDLALLATSSALIIYKIHSLITCYTLALHDLSWQRIHPPPQNPRFEPNTAILFTNCFEIVCKPINGCTYQVMSGTQYRTTQFEVRLQTRQLPGVPMFNPNPRGAFYSRDGSRFCLMSVPDLGSEGKFREAYFLSISRDKASATVVRHCLLQASSSFADEAGNWIIETTLGKSETVLGLVSPISIPEAGNSHGSELSIQVLRIDSQGVVSYVDKDLFHQYLREKFSKQHGWGPYIIKLSKSTSSLGS